MRRDWLQVNTGSEQVVAISRIIWPGQKDPKGYINGTTRPVVAGGTGWTVQFGIQAGHSIDVFDMITNKWWEWAYNLNSFTSNSDCIPPLHEQFTGVGSRELTAQGAEAIKDVLKSLVTTPL